MPKKRPAAVAHSSARDLPEIAMAVLLLCATLIAYFPALNGDLLWDDDGHKPDAPKTVERLQGGSSRTTKKRTSIWGSRCRRFRIDCLRRLRILKRRSESTPRTCKRSTTWGSPY